MRNEINICSACQKENHFALKCAQKKKPGKTKKPRHRKPPHKHSVNQFDFDGSGEDLFSVSCYEEEINAIDNLSNKILATMKIGGKNVKTLIYSGASCNVLPIKYLPKGTVVEKSSHTLKMYSKSIMSAVGQAKISLVNPENMENYLIDFTNFDGNFAPLLRLETAQKMKLLVVKTQNIMSIQASRVSVSFVGHTAHCGTESEHQVLIGSHIFISFREYWYYLVLSSNIHVKREMMRENNPVRLTFDS